MGCNPCIPHHNVVRTKNLHGWDKVVGGACSDPAQPELRSGVGAPAWLKPGLSGTIG